MGLATPTALMVGSGLGLRAGILFKRASALELITRIRVMLFDKTGTLTVGRPELESVVALDGDENGALSFAAIGAAGSIHPLSRAVTAERTSAKSRAAIRPRQLTRDAGPGRYRRASRKTDRAWQRAADGEARRRRRLSRPRRGGSHSRVCGDTAVPRDRSQGDCRAWHSAIPSSPRLAARSRNCVGWASAP